LQFKLNVPFEIGSSSIIKKGEHSYRERIYTEDKLLTYLPIYGFLGDDSLIVILHDKNNYERTINITVNIHIVKPPLESNLDYTISYFCNDNKLGRVKSFDIGFYDESLHLQNKLYDDNTVGIGSTKYYRIILRYSMKSTYALSPYNQNLNNHNPPSDLVKHDSMFKENYNNLVQITCNYPNGYLNLIYPVNRDKDWYATKPSPKGDSSIVFSRNDLFFYVSYLSELHSKLYLKSYQKTQDKEVSFENANSFMEKVFPNSHYTAELLHNFDIETKQWNKIDYEKKFDEDNKIYFDIIKTLADELTNGNILKVIDKIADNYESYYLSSEKKCLDKTICGTLFPEYTKLITSNNDFSNGLSTWITNENLVEPATGKIEYLPSNNIVNIEYTSNRPDNTDAGYSSLDLYKREYLNGTPIENYFFQFKMNQIYGGADGGFSPRLGYNDSGFAGVYICFNAINDENLGCIAWSDHTNKSALIYHDIESNSTFYNIRQDNVVRRIKPLAKDIAYRVDLSNYLKNKLPEVYKRKDEIISLEYGMFTTEFRNPNNGCYFCEAKLQAEEISLFKIKE